MMQVMSGRKFVVRDRSANVVERAMQLAFAGSEITELLDTGVIELDVPEAPVMFYGKWLQGRSGHTLDVVVFVDGDLLLRLMFD